ncbi:MAG TPA: DUF362 domain-containing protein [Candidatus Hydrogenedentes bacterium]|nr:DUF362 domain-containing protein [Candidatus Hydrogenedentota bacterium]HPG69852.1 DUF362 domain-containing protein [Candidatus Hydrogenedentota bacterium]
MATIMRTRSDRAPARGERPALSRRTFLACAAGGLWAGLAAAESAATSTAPAVVEKTSRVALTQGASRADNILEILKRIEPQVRAGLAGKKTVVIKPNMVVTDNQLSATHVECLEGLLEFLSPMVDGEILVAETPANGPAAEGFANYDYGRLEKAYRVKLVDLDQQPWETGFIVDERHHPQPVRLSQVLLDPDAYIVSTAPFKTHDRAVVTLGLKNVAVGAILKDVGYRWGAGSQGKTDKHLVHGGQENQGIHFNLFSLAQRLAPDLNVLDGFQGSEHNGPIHGTPVDHQVAVASTDWLAADRVATDLMGFDHNKVGYLVFAARAGMGETDVERIDILGPPINQLRRSYQPHDSIEKQYQWM